MADHKELILNILTKMNIPFTSEITLQRAGRKLERNLGRVKIPKDLTSEEKDFIEKNLGYELHIKKSFQSKQNKKIKGPNYLIQLFNEVNEIPRQKIIDIYEEKFGEKAKYNAYNYISLAKKGNLISNFQVEEYKNKDNVKIIKVKRNEKK